MELKGGSCVCVAGIHHTSPKTLDPHMKASADSLFMGTDIHVCNLRDVWMSAVGLFFMLNLHRCKSRTDGTDVQPIINVCDTKY